MTPIGRHHHLGTNTWAGSGATPPPEEEAQLLEWTIELPDAASLDAVAESLVRAGYPAERGGDAGSGAGRRIRDPWGTPIRIHAS